MNPTNTKLLDTLAELGLKVTDRVPDGEFADEFKKLSLALLALLARVEEAERLLVEKEDQFHGAKLHVQRVVTALNDATARAERAESSLALALKSQRTKGTREVCEKIKVIGAGQLEQCTAYPEHPHLFEHCQEWDCPLKGGEYGKKACPLKAPQQEGV